MKPGKTNSAIRASKSESATKMDSKKSATRTEKKKPTKYRCYSARRLDADLHVNVLIFLYSEGSELRAE